MTKGLHMLNKLNYIKKALLLIGFLVLLGCSNASDNKNASKVVLLRVDFMTSVFEGGKELVFSVDRNNLDTIPILVDYKPPGDFGNITLYYQPSGEMIFDGGIIWMGTGQINYPENFRPPDEFELMETAIELPDASKFQIVFDNLDNQSIDYASIWNAISNLKIVDDYLKENKKIGLFLYTPSVGVGDPNEWDWFVILNH